MEVIEINCNEKIFKIKKDVIIYVLSKVTGKDFSEKDNEIILKTMKKFRLIDEMTLESMQAL